MSGSAAFLEAVKARRSIYTIGSESTISDEKIEEIIATAVKHAPSSFNVQSSRVRPYPLCSILADRSVCEASESTCWCGVMWRRDVSLYQLDTLDALLAGSFS